MREPSCRMCLMRCTVDRRRGRVGEVEHRVLISSASFTNFSIILHLWSSFFFRFGDVARDLAATAAAMGMNYEAFFWLISLGNTFRRSRLCSHSRRRRRLPSRSESDVVGCSSPALLLCFMIYFWLISAARAIVSPRCSRLHSIVISAAACHGNCTHQRALGDSSAVIFTKMPKC